MIRRLFLTILLCLVTLNLSAQSRVDRFGDYNAMVGKVVRLYNAVPMAQHQGYFAYRFEVGEPVLIKDISIYQELGENSIHVQEVVTYENDSFLKVSLNGSRIYLILNKEYDYLANVRSISYWNDEYNRLKDNFAYIKITSNLVFKDYAKHYSIAQLSEYLLIEWCPLNLPKDNKENVLFRFKIARTGIEYALSSDAINSFEKDFISTSQFKKEEASYTKKNKIDNTNASVVGSREDMSMENNMDSLRVFVADVKLTDDVEALLSYNDISYEESDDLVFYVYGVTEKRDGYGSYVSTQRFYKGYLWYHDIELPEKGLTFRNESDKTYINTRKANGEDVRKVLARKHGASSSRAQSEKKLQKLQTELEELTKMLTYYKSNGIFILNQRYSFSDYKFGLEFEFFNCFKKDIKYIYLTIGAYNQVGDKQRDEVGRDTAETRCIGPISPSSTATFDFDELFWNRNGIIDKLKLEKVVVTFMDNTSVTYVGKSKIDKLRLDNYPPLKTDKPIEVGSALDFKNLISGINWQWTEQELINYLGYKVRRDKKEVWEEENSVSNYCFDGVTVCGIPLYNSYIRVNKYTQKIYRINFNVLIDATDLTAYPKIDKALIDQFGTPTEQTQNDLRMSSTIWEFEDYTIKAIRMDLSNVLTEEVEKYGYTISIEPN